MIDLLVTVFHVAAFVLAAAIVLGIIWLWTTLPVVLAALMLDLGGTVGFYAAPWSFCAILGAQHGSLAARNGRRQLLRPDLLTRRRAGTTPTRAR